MSDTIHTERLHVMSFGIDMATYAKLRELTSRFDISASALNRAAVDKIIAEIEQDEFLIAKIADSHWRKKTGRRPKVRNVEGAAA